MVGSFEVYFSKDLLTMSAVGDAIVDVRSGVAIWDDFSVESTIVSACPPVAIQFFSDVNGAFSRAAGRLNHLLGEKKLDFLLYRRIFFC